MRYITIIIILFISSCASTPHSSTTSKIDLSKIGESYSRDVLRGSNTTFRNWWDVKRYDLVLVPHYEKKSIEGTVSIEIEKLEKSEHNIIQIDLQEPMVIDKIVELTNDDKRKKRIETVISLTRYKRLDNTYFIDVSQLKNISKKYFTLKFYFKGNPKVAKNAPWDGGWIFTTDDKGRPWMSAAVQGLGASSWFPCKDYQGDEPDNGVTFTLIVPEDLVAVANGRLWETSLVQGEAGTNVYTWEVKNPINSYNIIPYIGHYKNISDQYMGKSGPLSLEYWVLDYNVKKAKKHFEQVKPMLTSFEEWMGPYPFYQDGYKLVESPYLGMEHQSAVAYGNQFVNGYLGDDRTNSGWGNKFDFIIVHESGHEWFGNSITVADVADLWVHEGFTTYSEVIYVEDQFGIKAANSYVQGLRPLIANKRNIVGTYGNHSGGSRDMYYKGAMMLHTLRQWMQDDAKFKAMIQALNKKYYHQIVSSQEIEHFIADYTGMDLTAFFNQYLRTTQVPTLAIKKEQETTYYRWENVVTGFEMPIKLMKSEEWILPTSEWKIYNGSADLIPDANFYVFHN